MSKSLKVVLSLHQYGGECGPLVSILVSNIQECFLGGVCNDTAKIQKSQTWNCVCEARITAIQQKGSMEYYFQEFELLKAQATSMPKEQLIGYFLARLRQYL
ncbi:hypothetical protein KIW84_061830 [Lathyrus oleraceus]|uniref:Retrotransposon gag domain-containing protein n=1 Tax=Pisum sativum TaxID=3888 RepID=A0A9D4W6S1_PEA|nr:hypothetical protein KIW84_061830 [Pisum sativum]